MSSALEEKLQASVVDGGVPCATAWDIAGELNVGKRTVGDEMDRLVAFVEERREALEEVHLLPYHRIAENKYFKLRMKQQLPEAEEPDRDFMEQLRRKFETTSLAVTIGG